MAADGERTTTPPSLAVPVNLTISVDLTGILPEGLRDPRTQTMVVNLEQIYILTITSATQLELLKVDFVKKAIQVLCWECFQIGLLKRNFKMWLQTSPYNTPGFPYGRFCAVDYDMTWKEVLDIHQIPHDHRHIHLRAHHSESAQEWDDLFFCMVRHLEVESTHYMFGANTGPVSMHSVLLCFILDTAFEKRNKDRPLS